MEPNAPARAQTAAPVFYDLSNTVYVIALQPPPEPITRPAARPIKKPAPASDEPKKQAPGEEGEEFVALDGEEEEPAPAEEGDTFIQEVDEDSSDMSGIVDAPADSDDKE